MTEQNTWFVTRYPSKEANDGDVLWHTENVDKSVVEAEASRLQALHPELDFEVSDLPDLMTVYQRDIVPVLGDRLNTTLH